MINHDDILTKIIDAPDTLTTGEINCIVSDPEMRALYHTAVLVKAAAQPPVSADTDQAWADFLSRIGQTDPVAIATPVRPTPWRRIWRIAAAAAILIAISIFSAKIARHTDNLTVEDLMATIDTIIIPTTDIAHIHPHAPAIADAGVSLKDTIIENISRPTPTSYYRIPAKQGANIAKADVKNAEADIADAPESVESTDLIIATQQARIENRIATARAEQYRSAYSTMQRSYGYEPEFQPSQVIYYNDAPSQNNFMRVVMP